MNIDQAAINISNVLQDSRIETPKGPLTSREHQQLAADLHLLISRAKEVDELEKSNKELTKRLDDAVDELNKHLYRTEDTTEIPEVPEEDFLSEEEEKEILEEIKEAPDPGPIEGPKE